MNDILLIDLLHGGVFRWKKQNFYFYICENITDIDNKVNFDFDLTSSTEQKQGM